MEEIIQAIERMKLSPTQELLKLVSGQEIQRWIIDSIQNIQLFNEGVGEENIIIGYYSPYTEELNPEKKAYTHFTLKDTGEFYRSMRIIILKDGFLIDAEGDKEDSNGEMINLFEKYGQEQNLLGFTEINLQLFIDLLKDKTIEDLRNG